MVELKYIKRKRRKKAAIICSGVASLAIAFFIIMAFLGRVVGTFTVSIKTETVKMTLSTTSDFQKNTTYLWVNNVPDMDIYTHSAMLNHDQIDSETTDWHLGAKKDKKGNEKFLYFFKYTFFVKNTGSKIANYDFAVNIVENNLPKNVAYGLDDIIRVRLYDNVGVDDHEYETYAKKTRNAVHYDEEGNPHYEEAISTPVDTTGTFYGYATEFASDTVICNKTVNNFAPEDVRRYTLLCWLEGNDPQAVATAPERCSIKLGVTITADEVKKAQ